MKAAAELARLRGERAELLSACQAAYEWLDKFGAHAPIQFGGEAELSEQLCAALERKP
jgi:hypothetical protein